MSPVKLVMKVMMPAWPYSKLGPIMKHVIYMSIIITNYSVFL
jgi:hypothetical protein